MRRGGRGLRFFLFRRMPSPLLFPFSLFSFRPSNLGLFGAPLQTPVPEKKSLTACLLPLPRTAGLSPSALLSKAAANPAGGRAPGPPPAVPEPPDRRCLFFEGSNKESSKSERLRDPILFSESAWFRLGRNVLPPIVELSA